MCENEKVIRGLECCQKKACIYDDTLKECPYWELCGEYEDAFYDCTKALAKDALALLKAQEPVKPILKREGWNKYHNDYVCPVCDQELVYEQSYCSECGRAVRWDG